MNNSPFLRNTVDHLKGRFSTDLNAIFGNNAFSAFVFGGFAKGYADKSHDIDVFIIPSALDEGQIARFRTLYFETHDLLKLPADHVDPGEIVSRSQLMLRLEEAEKIEISSVIHSYRDYETIVWIDAIAGPKIMLHDCGLIEMIESRAKLLFSTWRTQLLTMAPPSIAVEHLSTTQLFERFVTYEKQK